MVSPDLLLVSPDLLQYVCSFSDLSGIMGRSNMTRLWFYALPESVCTQVAFKSNPFIVWGVLAFLTLFLTIGMERVLIIVLGLTVRGTGLNPAMNGQIVWNYT